MNVFEFQSSAKVFRFLLSENTLRFLVIFCWSYHENSRQRDLPIFCWDTWDTLHFYQWLPHISVQVSLSRGYMDLLCMDKDRCTGLNGLYVFLSIVPRSSGQCEAPVLVWISQTPPGTSVTPPVHQACCVTRWNYAGLDWISKQAGPHQGSVSELITSYTGPWGPTKRDVCHCCTLLEWMGG